MTEAGLFEQQSTGDSGPCEPEIHNPVAPGYGPTSGLLDGRAVLARNQKPGPAETSFRVAGESPGAAIARNYTTLWFVNATASQGVVSRNL